MTIDWTLRNAAIVAGLMLALPVPAIAAEPPGAITYEPYLDGATDRIVRRAPVPREGDAHGEVRLIRRRDATVVQTLLESNVLKRVVAEIAHKERTNWGPDTEHRDDALAYVAALEKAATNVWHEHMRREDRRTHKQKLVIELVRSKGAAFIALYELPGREIRDREHLAAKQVLRVLEPAREYVERNMVLIGVDALGLDPDEAARLTRERPSGSGAGDVRGSRDEPAP